MLLLFFKFLSFLFLLATLCADVLRPGKFVMAHLASKIDTCYNAVLFPIPPPGQDLQLTDESDSDSD